MTMNESESRPAAIDPETASATAIAVTPGEMDRISWGAIFAGLVCAVALQALLTLLGVAWGFAAIDPTEELNPFAGFALGAHDDAHFAERHAEFKAVINRIRVHFPDVIRNARGAEHRSRDTGVHREFF